jgi:YHS domain-containing protein
MFRQSLAWMACFSVAIVMAINGCGRPPATKGPTAAANHGEEHAHKPAAHGGTIIEIGRDNYHAEVLFEKGGALRLYMLGNDEARVQEVAANPLEAYATLDGDTEAIKFTLEPSPQPGDSAGQTSLFIAQLPKEAVGKKVNVTIPNVAIGGERFRIAFSSTSDPSASHGMPDKVADEAERTLYLTPGGKYTAADIEANGRQVASQKFRGLKAQHDLKPMSGEKLCPISMTKANPKFSWVIGGKTYEFCCPPCVDEFLQTAKDKPDEIKDPSEYIKK